MGWRLVEDSSERTGGDGRESLSEARRSVAGARKRLEDLADRLREIGRRLGGGGRADSPPDLGSGGTPPHEQAAPRGRP